MSDRKYRHRGYQDDDGDRDRERRPPRSRGGEDRFEGGPRGRGVGLSAEVVFKCAVCGRKQSTMGRLSTDAVCSECGKPLHTCTNCAHFDPSARFECHKPIPSRVEGKSSANRCELFQAKAVRELRSKTSEAASPQDARAAFDALFKKR